MWCLVIIVLICENINNSIADIPTIIIDIKENNTCEVVQSPFLRKDEEFQFVANHNYHPCLNGTCTFQQNLGEVFVPAFPTHTHNQSVFYGQALSKMATDWFCQFNVSRQKGTLTNPCESVDINAYATVNCSLKVYIQEKAEGIMYMKVNEEMVQTKSINNPNDYDSYGIYYFNDGELAKFTCASAGGFAKITFLNTTDYIPIDTKSRWDYITLDMKLKNEFHGTFLNCTKTNPPQQIHSVIRLQLLSNIINGAICGFTVNGLKYFNKLKDSYYVYEYYDNELLNINSFIENFESSVNTNCKNTGNQNLPEEFEGLFSNIESNVDLSVRLKKDHSGLNITCLMGQTQYNYQYPKTWIISLALVFDTTITYYEPYIGGLSMSKTLAKYQHATHDNIIVYDYGGETLNLTCHSSYPYGWNYNHKEVQAGNETMVSPSSLSAYQVSRTFKLIGNITQSTIRCIVKDDSGGNKAMRIEPKTTAVELVRSDNGANRRATTNVLSGTAGVYEASSEFNNNSVTTAPTISTPDRTRTKIMAGCGLLVLLIVISACVLVTISIRKRKKHNPPLTDIDYRNLPHHNEAPTAMPSQWDTYAEPADLQESSPYSVPYTEKNLDNLYSKPLPKNKRNKKEVEETIGNNGSHHEPSYATIGNNGGHHEPSYATIGNNGGHHEPSYATIGNNGGHHEPSYATTGNNVGYQEGSYANVGKNVVLNEPSYVKIDKISQHAKHNEYANETHANATDPSYSQVLPKTRKPGQKQMIPPQLFKELHTKVLPKREREYDEGDGHISGNNPSHYNNVRGESEDNYAIPDKNKYSNEFDSRRYFNSNSKEDYTEPAYCEPYLKK